MYLLSVPLSIIASTRHGFRLDAIFNLSKRIFGVQHIDMTLESRGIMTLGPE
jgi:hypothetical protein